MECVALPHTVDAGLLGRTSVISSAISTSLPYENADIIEIFRGVVNLQHQFHQLGHCHWRFHPYSHCCCQCSHWRCCWLSHWRQFRSHFHQRHCLMLQLVACSQIVSYIVVWRVQFCIPTGRCWSKKMLEV